MACLLVKIDLFHIIYCWTTLPDSNHWIHAESCQLMLFIFRGSLIFPTSANAARAVDRNIAVSEHASNNPSTGRRTKACLEMEKVCADLQRGYWNALPAALPLQPLTALRREGSLWSDAGGGELSSAIVTQDTCGIAFDTEVFSAKECCVMWIKLLKSMFVAEHCWW